MRSNMIFAVRVAAHEPRPPQNSQERPPSLSSRLKISRRFSIRSERLQEMDDTSSVRTILPNPQQHSGLTDIPRRPNPDASIQTSSRSNLGYSLGISGSLRSSIVGDMSIFRFGRDRQLGHQPSHVWLPPSQAPSDATNVLLLGTSGSGKSTLIKSLMYAFNCFDITTRQSYLDAIFDNTIQSILTLVKQRSHLSIDEASLQLNLRIVSEAENQDLGYGPLPLSIGSAIAALWDDLSVKSSLANQRTKEKRFPLMASAE